MISTGLNRAVNFLKVGCIKQPAHLTVFKYVTSYYISYYARHLRVDVPTEDCALYRLEKDQWATAVRPVDVIEDVSAPDTSTIGVTDLRTNDHLILCASKDNVGPKRKLEALAQNFKHNPALRAKVQSLAQAYVGYRPIRGDGNCYYR